MTEITEITGGDELRGHLLFDGECPMCRDNARRLQPLLARHGYQFLELQDDRVVAAFPGEREALMREMRLVSHRGEVFNGGDVFFEIARTIWWARPFYALGFVPGVRPLARRAYRWVAENRYCPTGACSVPVRPWWPGWLPLLLGTTVAVGLGFATGGWIAMVLISFTLYFALKWLSWWRVARRGRPTTTKRLAAYLLFWPGMNPEEFLFKNAARKPRAGEFAAALAKTAFGAALVWILVPRMTGAHPLAVGWVGMMGFVFMLHFGSFQLIAHGWQSAGVAATPIMRAPVLARSLAEFWGERWNLAFRDLVNPLLFRPIAAKRGSAAATLATFAVSGLIHELAISVPARAGYGLPTLYFLIQGLGLLFERSATAKRMRLRVGARGRVFTLIVTAAPAFLLFHPPFVTRVMLPLLEALGAL